MAIDTQGERQLACRGYAPILADAAAGGGTSQVFKVVGPGGIIGASSFIIGPGGVVGSGEETFPYHIPPTPSGDIHATR